MEPYTGGSGDQHGGNSPNRDPSGGGPSGGGPSGETIETEEEYKKRRKREIRAKYNNSEKGKRANNKWKTENAEKVKKSKRKYNKSEK
ncbi:hypothetical protein MMC19_007663, partial [Ptychographa xylographoides]|nr:hypothetical protein [Ptychographa xylographoides]